MATTKKSNTPDSGSAWDFESIQELVKLVSKSTVTEVEIEQDNFKIRVSKNGNAENVVYTSPQVMPSMMSAPQALPPAAEKPVADAKGSASADAPAADANTFTFKSPMIGTFYRSSSPDKDAFVKPGDSISPGSVLCIIEAMKLFNEIESDISGKIIKVLVENAQPVEYDQPLFLIEINK